ncbi:MAG: response regulator [Myxococcales bacterium]|nr:response regulator [Myxococcales bacterium]
MPRATVTQRNATILVVDDDADIRDALGMVLRDEGYHVVPALDGQAALDILNAGVKPAAILLDLMMPRMNGLEFLERSRELLGFARIPVIVVSANQGYDASDLGVAQVVRKPFTAEVVIEALGRAAA